MRPPSQNLDGFACTSCGKLFVIGQFRCSECGSSQFKKKNFTGKGRIDTFTIIRVPPQEFNHEAPYTVAIVKLDEGPLITARIDGNPENLQLKIGAVARFVRKENSRYWFRI
ncbi:MAG: Zn-ribbon domain-containing OB-fold protein [Candidatus Bathyarchaeia archaeon]